MEIKHLNDEKNGRFYVEENGETLALMTYVWAGSSRLIIDHTEVSDTLKGTGTGKKLVEAAVNYARENGYKIYPVCPFARAVFDKTPDYADVRA